jgi:cysteinyl-tRNA synthetase
MPLKLYNTLTRKEEVFKPIKDKIVKMYSCGPTVYWYQHIGNLRTYIFSDILKRVLLYNGYHVKQVMNITDVGHLTSDADEGEDKMEKAAMREGKKAQDIANYYLGIFRDDFKKLNILEPTIWCRATEHIKEQIELIKKLEKKGYTYRTSDGIYFDTSKFKDYGKMAKIKVGKLIAGKRTEMRDKRNKTDFALWKFSPSANSGERRQQEWNSPWGVGFPGWHIECSAMSMKYLGETFDIHTGGMDHIPIHHTNEIAQSEAATGKKFVNYWVHGAFLLFNREKISKSKGGLYTVSQLQEKGFEPLDYRYFCLTKQYGKPLNFSLELLEGARSSYERMRNVIYGIKNSEERTNLKNIENAKKKFLEIINDDLNMPRALSFLWDILRDERLNESEKYKLALDFDKVFGLNLMKEESIEVPKEVRKLVKEREEMRKKKNWQEADSIRKRINKLGFSVDDTEEGARIRRL